MFQCVACQKNILVFYAKNDERQGDTLIIIVIFLYYRC